MARILPAASASVLTHVMGSTRPLASRSPLPIRQEWEVQWMRAA